jgi:hypothetical protein
MPPGPSLTLPTHTRGCWLHHLLTHRRGPGQPAGLPEFDRSTGGTDVCHCCSGGADEPPSPAHKPAGTAVPASTGRHSLERWTDELRELWNSHLRTTLPGLRPRGCKSLARPCHPTQPSSYPCPTGVIDSWHGERAVGADEEGLPLATADVMVFECPHVGALRRVA